MRVIEKIVEKVKPVFIDALKAMPFAFLVWYVGSFVHEGAHWVFIVPFGGVLRWHWWPPGWDYLVPASGTWATISLWAGGLAADVFEFSLLVLVLLILVLRSIRKCASGYWWYLGAGLASVIPSELFIGVFEGRFNSLYGNPVWQLCFYGPVGLMIGFAGFLCFRMAISK